MKKERGMKMAALSVLMFPLLLRGEMVETDRFEDVLSYIEASSGQVLVVSDLDNTLMRAKSQFGSVEWSDHLVRQLEEKGIDSARAQVLENAIWQAIQPHIEVQEVGEHTRETITEIQKRRIPFMGLTGRTPAECDVTRQQLKTIGIDFECSNVPKGSVTFPLKPSAAYERGILFATPFQKKSAVLAAFLDEFGLKPECIIFIDDKMSHVRDVARLAEVRGIRYVGIRLSAQDEAVSQFNPALAAIQWSLFPQPLSDAEAEKILKSHEESLAYTFGLK